MPAFPHGQTRVVWAAQMLTIMGVGAAVYLGACGVMGVDTLTHILPRRKRGL